MRFPLTHPAAVVVLSALLAGGAPPSRHATPVSPLAIDSAVRRMAAIGLWPGWDPLATPLAIFDGANTIVFRHPSPGPAYHSLSSVQGAWVREGRDPAITANTSATLGGVSTATVLLDSAGTRSADDWGALAIHELFHVYQRRAHPAWAGNEADLFTYPMEDRDALALRREETFVLAEALASTDDDEEAVCWAENLAAVRGARFGRIGAAAAAYERGTELNEGLAHHVELVARGKRASIRPDDYPAEQVRQRAYDSGAVLAAVLTQLDPAWRDTLDHAPGAAKLSLDELLTTVAMRRKKPGAPNCSARAEHRARFAREAARDVDSLLATRARRRSEFLAQPGYTLVIDAGTGPLFPQGFDPLNVSRLTDTDILHTRFVKLGRDGATVEVLGRAALSSGTAGQHPLFNGVRRVVVTGLPVAPSMSDSAGVTLVRADGVNGRFARARVQVRDREVVVTLP